MFYFRTAPFYTTNTSELAQFQKVVRFRGKLEKLGVLFWEYSSPLQFERNVREHLIRQIRQWVKPSKEASTSSARKGSKAREKTTKSKARALLTSGGARIFLAYAREDLNIVKLIYYGLRDAGYQPWLDVEALLPGQNWLSEIERAVKDSDVFLAFLSSHAVQKRGYVQREIKMAYDIAHELRRDELFLVPVRLEPVELPESLRSYQWIDYFAEGGPERLVLTIKMAVEQRRKHGGRYA